MTLSLGVGCKKRSRTSHFGRSRPQQGRSAACERLRRSLRVRIRQAVVGLSCVAVAAMLTACGDGGLANIEFSPVPVTWFSNGEQDAKISATVGNTVPFTSIYTTNPTMFKITSDTCTSPLTSTPCDVKIKLEGTYKKQRTETLVVENAASAKASDLLVTE